MFEELIRSWSVEPRAGELPRPWLTPKAPASDGRIKAMAKQLSRREAGQVLPIGALVPADKTRLKIVLNNIPTEDQ